MYILTIRTDKPEAEIGIFENTNELNYVIWKAHRCLAETIHLKIKDLLERSQLQLSQIEAVAVFQGPGSFTGLRIGISVANALAASKQVTIVGAGGEDWKQAAIKNLLIGENHQPVIPEYGALPNITAQRK